MDYIKALVLLLMAGVIACGAEREATPRFDASFIELVSPDLLRQANHGRHVIASDGYLTIPKGVTRVWVDVGAHLLETTLAAVQKNSDLALIAIEPRSEASDAWPDEVRIIGLPVALGRTRGSLDFRINKLAGASSLLPSDPERSALPLTDIATTTVEIRKVPVLLLEDVLERIPPHIDIEFLKLDIQGVDLQVLKSGGDELRRVWHVKTEVIVHNEGAYIGEGEDASELDARHPFYWAAFVLTGDWN